MDVKGKGAAFPGGSSSGGGSSSSFADDVTITLPASGLSDLIRNFANPHTLKAEPKKKIIRPTSPVDSSGYLDKVLGDPAIGGKLPSVDQLEDFGAPGRGSRQDDPYIMYISSVAISYGGAPKNFVVMPRGFVGSMRDALKGSFTGSAYERVPPSDNLLSMQQTALSYLRISPGGAHLKRAGVQSFLRNNYSASALGTLVGLVGALFFGTHSSGHLNRSPDDIRQMYQEQLFLVTKMKFDGHTVRE